MSPPVVPLEIQFGADGTIRALRLSVQPWPSADGICLSRSGVFICVASRPGCWPAPCCRRVRPSHRSTCAPLCAGPVCPDGVVVGPAPAISVARGWS